MLHLTVVGRCPFWYRTGPPQCYG